MRKFAKFQKQCCQVFSLDDKNDLIERYKNIEVYKLPPLVLAYIGDAYFHLYVRQRLLLYEQHNVQILHTFGATIVSAVWQAKAYRGIKDKLTEEERTIFRRARNAKSHAPRSASVADYHISTGFEALLGSLYLQKNIKRLDELLESVFQFIVRDIYDSMQTNTKI